MTDYNVTKKKPITLITILKCFIFLIQYILVISGRIVCIGQTTTKQKGINDIHSQFSNNFTAGSIYFINSYQVI